MRMLASQVPTNVFENAHVPLRVPHAVKNPAFRMFVRQDELHDFLAVNLPDVFSVVHG